MSMRGLPERWIHIGCVLGLILLGLVVGLPTLDGQFLAGDDSMLLRDHALVNHPSLANAFELLTIIHRDLYQPLPMLSVQLDFLLYGQGQLQNPWGIHLTNVLYHILNGFLAWLLIGQLTKNRVLAFLVGAAFLTHPLAIEAVAWISGRWMLMSATFLLLALLCFDRWQVGRRNRWLLISLVCCVACMLSKVRIELPFLIVFLRYYRGLPWRDVRWWVGFVLLGTTTVAFSFIAIETTDRAGVWEEASTELRGPGLARATLTLGWYLAHYVWPANLAGWYAPPPEVHWTHPAVLGSIPLIALALGGTILAWRRGHRSAVGMAWFLVSIGPMLQFVPSRLTLACDRYMYIPMFGLHWMFGAAGLDIVRRMRLRRGSRVPNGAAVAATVVVLALWVRGSIVHGRDYADDVALRARDTVLYPNLPGAWARLAWAYIRLGHYSQAIAAAERDLALAGPNVSMAHQAIGWASLMLHRYDQAIEHLKTAIAVEPSSPKPYYRLARVYDLQGKHDQAIELYRESIQRLGFYEPAIMSLANLYRKLGRTSEAKALYERALANNRNQYIAEYNLGTIELAEGMYPQALSRFQHLLGWMPENADARTQLGACLVQLGRAAEALKQYDRVLEQVPDHVLARLNRAGLQSRVGNYLEAEADYEYLLKTQGYVSPVLEGLDDLYLASGRLEKLADLWNTAWVNTGRSDEAFHARAAWSAVLARRTEAATQDAQLLLKTDPSQTLAMLTMGWVAMEQSNIDQAEDWFVRAARTDPEKPPGAIRMAMAALERQARFGEGSPAWPYYVTAVLLAGKGQYEPARLGFREFLARTQDPVWRARAEKWLAAIPTGAPGSKPTTVTTVP